MRILVLGGTGMLGRPVVNRLIGNHQVRLLTRSAAKARGMFGDAIEVAEGTITAKADLRAAMSDCDAVHLNLTPATEYAAMREVIELGRGRLARISYVSATTLSEHPPPLHFFAAPDFGRIVASSFDDERGLGKALYVYGPEAITLSDATERFIAAWPPEGPRHTAQGVASATRRAAAAQRRLCRCGRASRVSRCRR
jgi:uncharacterized protein YbjT (DUF2867 family)